MDSLENDNAHSDTTSDVQLLWYTYILKYTYIVHHRVQYVKDYDGGTHMECYVHPTIPYLGQAAMFAKQRQWLIRRITEVSSSTRVYDGLPASSFTDGTYLNRADIPGEKEGNEKGEISLAVVQMIFFRILSSFMKQAHS